MAGTFVGVVHLAGGRLDERYDDRARRAVAQAPRTRPGVRRSDDALFAHNESGPGLPAGRGRKLFAAAARLDNRVELGEALGLAAPELARTSNETLLLRMFERWGGDGIARCLGAFAFAHWDTDARRLTLGRDCLGHCSLLFHRNGDTVIFSNRLGALLAMPDVPREVDELGLANFLVVNRRDTRRTAYRGIERTPSRSLLTIDRSGVRQNHYWSPDFDAPPPYRRDEDYVERARELFDQAVLCASEGLDEVVIATSGGLDSSAIAATAARLGRASRIVCYTTLPPPDLNVAAPAGFYRDERDKVESLGRMYPAIELKFLIQGEHHPFDADADRYFEQALLPNLGGKNIGSVGQFMDVLSAHKVVLFGMRGNVGLTWTGQYSLLALMRAGQWPTLARELRLVARRKRQNIAQTLISDILKPAMPHALNRLWHLVRGRDPDSVARYSALNPDFIAQNDLLKRWREQRFDPWFGVNGWNPAQWRAWRLFDRAAIDLDNLDWAEQRRGIAIRDPFADRRLLEFALAVPEPLYRRNGVPRSFARAVFADRLPREILQEPQRGANHLAWFRTLDRTRPQIAADIERMQTSATARRLLDLPRLKRLLDDWPKDEHAAQLRFAEYHAALGRGLHVGSFIRWVEGGNG